MSIHTIIAISQNLTRLADELYFKRMVSTQQWRTTHAFNGWIYQDATPLLIMSFIVLLGLLLVLSFLVRAAQKNGWIWPTIFPRATWQRYWMMATKYQEQSTTSSASCGEQSMLLHEAACVRKREFLSRVGNTIYGYNGTPGGYIDTWRPNEFSSLIQPLSFAKYLTLWKKISFFSQTQPQEKEVYLDYAGAALPTKTQLTEIYANNLSATTILANPHSTGPAAYRSLVGIQEAKRHVLRHLNATPGRFAFVPDPPPIATAEQCHRGYEVLFTSGATEGLRLIAERFPWRKACLRCHRQSIFLYSHNSHTSLVGMRNLVKEKGGRFLCLPLNVIEQMTSEDYDKLFSNSSPKDTISCASCSTSDFPNLLAFPAECNFGGHRTRVARIVHTIQETQRSRWCTLVDIAKAASTGPISLKTMNVDFAVMSFYKLFGEPTGLGALVVKQSSLNFLRGDEYCYQGGGSVDIVLPTKDYCKSRSDGLAGLCHGTLHYRGIHMLHCGFKEIERRGGMHRIHEHATCLARELVQRLQRLKHGNGQPVIVISGAWGDPSLCESAGPTVAMNIVRSDESFVGYNEVSKLAALNSPPIQFRTGCFCNPGACQEALHLTDQRAITNFESSGHVCGDHIDIIDMRPTGAIRISFGKDSIWEDMDVFVQFIERNFLDKLKTNAQIKIASSQPQKVIISELLLFPIKSCAGQRVKQWKLEMPSGKLLYDREFALVDTSGTAMRLQTVPKMTTIVPQLDLNSRTMILSAPGMSDLVIYLDDDNHHGFQTGDNAIRVCGNQCCGKLWGDYDVSEWFSTYLGVQCWLARFRRDGSMVLPEKSSLERSVSSGKTSKARSGFANEQALLLLSENAVARLNVVLEGQQQRPVDSRRFRPNIVVRGGIHIEAKDHNMEDSWKRLTLTRNNVTFETRGRCARCAMVDFDPYNGNKGKSTLRALAKYRRHRGQITFGVFLGATKADDNDADDDNVLQIQEGDELLCYHE